MWLTVLLIFLCSLKTRIEMQSLFWIKLHIKGMFTQINAVGIGTTTSSLKKKLPINFIIF